jgi:3-hydroxybutyryl-CoA dehydrogenase
LGRIRGSLDLKEAVREVDLVIEAIHEDLNVKQQAFRQIDEYCPNTPSWPPIPRR